MTRADDEGAYVGAGLVAEGGGQVHRAVSLSVNNALQLGEKAVPGIDLQLQV